MRYVTLNVNERRAVKRMRHSSDMNLKVILSYPPMKTERELSHISMTLRKHSCAGRSIIYFP
jgi:hypothetical protein